MKNTPRDFFLHFGAFAALYAAAIALATLIFRLIDYAFPDPLLNTYYGYSDPYSSAMRFAIASLIVLVPLCLWLFRILQREARSMPERYMLTVRRWLTFITLFVAGGTIVGDLIALLNSFLGGELATPFLLKVATLLAITGAIFWYFLLDIRGHWQNRERQSKNIGFGALGVTIAVIVSGFFIMGSPMVQRELRFDEQQINDLSTIQNQIVNFWQQNTRLPQTLEEIQNELIYTIPTPPAGREPYEYHATGELTFELCATFARASSQYTSVSAPYTYNLLGESTWKHETGRACFSRAIDPDLIKPRPFFD